MISHKDGSKAICGQRIPLGTKIGDGPALVKRGPESCPICRGRQVVRKQRVVSRMAWQPDQDIDRAAKKVIEMEV
jgi:hypothetical protein